MIARLLQSFHNPNTVAALATRVQAQAASQSEARAAAAVRS